MTKSYLSIGRVERRLWSGNTESIAFRPGVNLLIGRPNTGKTQWLKFLDFLLGDPDAFESRFDEALSEKYEAASAELFIGDRRLFVERRWKESGLRSKVVVDGEPMDAVEFQHLVMGLLGAPILHYPKGNPQSGQTWPELSLRSLMRHIHRQQRFWGDLADKQPEGEQLACLLQFGGTAEFVYTEEYGELIGLEIDARRLTSRLEQFEWTLDALAQDLMDEGDVLVKGVTSAAIRSAEREVAEEIEELRAERTRIIEAAANSAESTRSPRIAALSAERAALLVAQEQSNLHGRETAERVGDMQRYLRDLTDELERLERADDAGQLLADLRITHCPACDQVVKQQKADPHHCHLCHQTVPDEPEMKELGQARLAFEKERLRGEMREATDLVDVLHRDLDVQRRAWTRRNEALRQIENELVPARAALAALAQESISAVDVALGRQSERQRQVGRLKAALATGQQLKKQVEEIEKLIEPLKLQVEKTRQAADFAASAAWLAEGMNAYLMRIEQLKPGAWSHSPIRVSFDMRGFDIRVGSRRWSVALGGSDTLYFLMAYHYGLMTLSSRPGLHYPGLAIIDLPGDFLGESVEDKENFIVQPFIELLEQEEFAGAQVIITGAAFYGLTGVHRQTLSTVYAGR